MVLGARFPAWEASWGNVLILDQLKRRSDLVKLFSMQGR